MKSNSERIVQMCFLLLCVRVIVQCLLHSAWDALEANDTYFVTRPGPGCLARACPRMIGCWSDSCPTENKGQLRMADALPGPLCSAATGWKPFTCLFPLFALGEPCAGLRLLTRTHKEGKGERSTEDHSPDFAEVPGEWKPFRDGKQNKTKKTGNKKRAGTCFASILPTIIIDTWFSSFYFHRWSPQTHKNWRGLCLQRQGGSPPLEPETLWSSWRGNIIPGVGGGGLLVIFCPEQTDVAFIPQ